MNVIKKLAIVFTFPLFLLPSTIYAVGATLSLSPATGTFNRGCAFSLEMKLDTGGAQTDGTDAILFYDSTRFTATAVKSGTIYSDYPGNNIDSQQGKITVSGLASATSAFSGSGTLATIDFTVLENAPTGISQMKFDFDANDKAKTTDSNVVEKGTVADILSAVGNGSFTIGTGICGTVTPTIGVKPIGGTEPLPTKTPVLPQSGSFETTMILASVGSLLVILGILGLALL